MAVKGIILRALGGFDVNRLIARGLFGAEVVVVPPVVIVPVPPQLPTVWLDNYLQSVSGFGTHEPMGAGPFGGTAWTDTEDPITTWKNNYLHDSAGFGTHEPMGSGPFGGTSWETVL